MAEDIDNENDEGKENCNLLVNYLPKQWTETEVKTLFSQHGNVTFVKVVRNRVTRESECYGFVRYDKHMSAQAAVDHINGYSVLGKRLKVQLSSPAPSGPERANLYIAGFPADWTEAQLTELVTPYGSVQEARVLINLQTQKSRQCGFVRMKDHTQALSVIQAINNKTQVAGRTLTVRFADKPREAAARKQLRMAQQRWNPMGTPMASYGSSISALSSPFSSSVGALSARGPLLPPPTTMSVGSLQVQPSAANAGVCLFVYHLPPTATASDLYQLFSNYGVVVSCKVMKDLQTGRPKGFGFVNMLNHQQADMAVHALNGYRMGPKYLQVSYKTDR